MKRRLPLFVSHGLLLLAVVLTQYAYWKREQAVRRIVGEQRQMISDLFATVEKQNRTLKGQVETMELDVGDYIYMVVKVRPGAKQKAPDKTKATFLKIQP